jgi:hypothetical protein
MALIHDTLGTPSSTDVRRIQISEPIKKLNQA